VGFAPQVFGEDSRHLRAGDTPQMFEKHNTDASGGEQSDNQTPRTRAVAVALQVRPERLGEFVECHPNPTPDAVLALSDRPPADQDTRDMVARWVEHATRDPTPIEDRPGGHPAGLSRGVEQ
jgi:hypothetical protein